MALKINRTKIGEKAWGEVDKTALGNALAKAYAAGDASKALIRFVYLYAPDDAFDKDSDGNPTFAHSKAKLPICEVSGAEVFVNRNGVHAAAGALGGARSMPDVPSNMMTAAKRRLRGLYRKLKEDIPDSLKEAIAALTVDKPIEELVKGSLQYAQEAIEQAFKAAFQWPSPWSPNEIYCPYRILDTFADAVIVKAWGDMDDLMPDEFYKVTFTKSGEGYTFAAFEDWEVVELTYQPQSTPTPAPIAEPVAESMPTAAVIAEALAHKVKRIKRFQEIVGAVTGDGKSIRSNAVMTAGIVNGNQRRYPQKVIEAAMLRMQTHLNESAGQGRFIQYLGEVGHPSDKKQTPQLLETVVKWDRVGFDGKDLSIAGRLIDTAKGKDVQALAAGGVKLPLSMRGYGDSRFITEGGITIEEVLDLEFTGFDLVEQPGFDQALSIVESQTDPIGEDVMDIEQLKALIAANPDLFKDLVKGDLDKMSADVLMKVESQIREALKLKPEDDLAKTLTEAQIARETLAAQQQQAAVDSAIAEATKELPYGKRNPIFIEAVRAAVPATPEAVKVIVEKQRAIFDKIAADDKLALMGWVGQPGVKVTGPVIERELGIPAFAVASYEFTEALVRRSLGKHYDYRKPDVSVNEMYARVVLERFDKLWGGYLRQEARRLEEAEQTVDLDLPYSAARAVIAQALPQLIATSVFDFGTIDASPTNVYYEEYAAETGLIPTITDESIDSDESAWVALAHQHLTPGTVVVTSDPAGTTYEEGVDYVIDYLNGLLYTLPAPGGTIGDATALLVDYTYTALREGEMAEIERGKGQITSTTLTCKADRLAQQISSEAVVFSRSQLGWDATARTLAMLTNDVRRKIDQGVMYLALAAALSVAANSGGTWDATADPLDYEDFSKKVGIARVLITKRFYTPTAVLMSTTNSDLIANSAQFTAAGARPDMDLNANGYMGRIKSLPVFESTEFTDDYSVVANRELVAHRVLQPLQIKGPYPTYGTNRELIAADQYYMEEYNGSVAPIPGKGSYVKITNA